MTAAALILCSGDSVRMGRPKALLDVDGVSFVARLTRVFREAGVARVIAIYGGVHVNVIATELRAWGIEGCRNPDPRDGPISSVRVGLRALMDRDDVEHCYVQPVDIPGLEISDIERLAAEADRRSFQVISPSIDGRRAHPVVLARSTWPLVDQVASLRELLALPEIVVEHVDLDNPHLRCDIDTPEALQRFRDAWR